MSKMYTRSPYRVLARAEKQYADVSVNEEVMVVDSVEEEEARFSLGCATRSDEFDAIAELVTDTAYENEGESGMMSRYAANQKLSQLRQEQAALRKEARDTQRFVALAAYDRERLVGCAYMKLRHESSLLASVSPGKAERDANTAATSPFSSMSSFMSYLVYGSSSASRASDMQPQERDDDDDDDDDDVVFYVSNVCVKPSDRRRGIARGIMELLRAEAEQRGIRTIYAHVNVDNHAARQLYARLGFENLGADEGAKDAVAGRFDRNGVLLLRADVTNA